MMIIYLIVKGKVVKFYNKYFQADFMAPDLNYWTFPAMTFLVTYWHAQIIKKKMKKGNCIPNKQIENLTQQGFCDKSFDVQKSTY